MRNDADYHVRSPRGGKFSSFPVSIRTISNYLRSVSANASSIAASTVRQATVSAASNGSLNHEDERQREQVQWSNFDKLELGSGEIREVLLLTYLNGFQVWDVQDANNVHELVSRRDGPVAFLRLQPKPILQESMDGVVDFKGARPLLLVVTSDGTGSGSPGAAGFSGGYGTGGGGTSLGLGASHFVPTVVRFYSLRNHSYVHTLRFSRGIHAVRCSPRVVAVALATQIYCFDAGTLQNMYNVLTYPSPAPAPGSNHYGYGALAVGARWLAYAANTPVVAITGRVSPQHLTLSPGASPSTSPASGNFVTHYAKESSKHIVAGVVTLSDMGYKTLSKYYSELMPDGGNASPGVGSPNGLRNGHSPWQGNPPLEPEFAGTVTIRDIVSKGVVAQFRAHSSPLSALSFDPSGTLLVTASVYGHNLNVFRLTPPSSSAGGNGTGGDTNATFAHLYKLSRGVTNAVIQDISFSSDSHWIAVSSSRGTNHLFAISPFGGAVGPQTHATVPIDGLIGPTLTPSPVFPWWSSTGLVSLNQQALPPPPPAITLNVVSRIKNGNGGWRGTVTSAAVTATGRPNVLAGAVAAVFHDGGGAGVESDIGVGTLKDQLWILCPTGHLLRYLLRPSVGGDGGYTVNGLPQMAGIGTPGSPGLPQELKVVVEPVERWDIARRPNWVEREERVEGEDAPHEEGGIVDNSGSIGIPVGAVAKEGSATEEMQRWFMSNAEVQMHQARPVPIWAKPKILESYWDGTPVQIQFHVMLSGTPKEAEVDDYPCEDGVGEIEIERIPTRIIEVRRRDLVPVIERLQKFTKVQGARDMMVSDTLPAVSSAHDQLLGDEGQQDGYMDGGLGGMPIERTGSCSSFGSEGAPFAASGGGMNGYHQHGYQDLHEVGATDTPPSPFGSPPYFHPSQPRIEPSLTDRSKLYQTSFTPKAFTADPGAAVIGSAINIPRADERDTKGMFAGYMKPSVGSAGFPPKSGIGAASNDDGANVGEGSPEILAGQLHQPIAQIGTTPVNDDYVAGATRQIISEDLILQENDDRVQHIGSGVNVATGKWSSNGQVIANGSLLHGIQSGGNVTTECSVLNPDFDPAFVIDLNRNHVMSDSPLDGSPGDGDTNRTAEDAESEDTEGGHSKSEENENAEQRDVDVLEGSMFPFCEEDC